MTANQLSLVAVVIPFFPIAYFFLSSLTFFVARFEDPVVIRVLRGLFHAYFLGLGLCALFGALAFTLIGRPAIAAAMAMAAALSVLTRRTMLRRLDTQVAARASGDPQAIPRLRRLHLYGIAYNAAHLVALLAGIPHIVTAH